MLFQIGRPQFLSVQFLWVWADRSPPPLCTDSIHSGHGTLLVVHSGSSNSVHPVPSNPVHSIPSTPPEVTPERECNEVRDELRVPSVPSFLMHSTPPVLRQPILFRRMHQFHPFFAIQFLSAAHSSSCTWRCDCRLTFFVNLSMLTFTNPTSHQVTEETPDLSRSP
jgi:hypothetical protein